MPFSQQNQVAECLTDLPNVAFVIGIEARRVRGHPEDAQFWLCSPMPGAAKLVSWSWIRYRHGSLQSSVSMGKVLACCAIQAASGWDEHPAIHARRLPSWMKNSA